MMNLGNFILSDDNGSWYITGEQLICYSPSGSVGYRFNLADYPTVEREQKVFTAVCEFAVAKKKLRSVTPVTYQSIDADY